MRRHIGRRLAGALLGILLIAGVPVWAQGVSNPIGQPGIVVRSEPSYYIWADQAGWHVAKALVVTCPRKTDPV